MALRIPLPTLSNSVDKFSVYLVHGHRLLLVLMGTSIPFSNSTFVSQALELQPTDKACLVARSKCYLGLGDTGSALKDAEASLSEDKGYNKVIRQISCLILVLEFPSAP